MNSDKYEILTRTNAGTSMGRLFRRYWLPVMTCDELPHPDCPPVRLPVLGEKLLAFRDTKGRVGIINEACPHRQASLYFGRNEECGIRCAYHGWKFDIEGRCMDIPSEPTGNKITERIQTTAYPAIECGEVIWVYMGPPEHRPPPPALEWTNLPADHLFITRRLQECNYLQVLEGGLDSSHLSWLHGGTLMDDPILGMGGAGEDARILEIMAADRSPRFQTIDTDGGLVIGARRKAAEGQYYWRITQFILPCFNLIAPTGDLSLNSQCWVPMDDVNCWSWAINYHMDKPLSEEERDYMHRGGGLHTEMVPGTFQGLANKDNDYMRDTDAQAAGKSFTGIPSFAMQDTAVQESQGLIADRSLEQLMSSDLAIARSRRALLRAIDDMNNGKVPRGTDSASHGVCAASIITSATSLRDISLESISR